jgi:transposase
MAEELFYDFQSATSWPPVSERYICRMQDARTLPEDLATCHAVITEQSARLDELSQQNADYKREVEELNLAIRKLLEGNRREKFTSSPGQLTLEFADDPDLQAALQQAQEEAEQITETITYQRKQRRKQKPRSEKFPEHLRREFFDAPVPDGLSTCPTHGPRQVIRYDELESLVYKRPELFVRVTRFPILACVGKPQCGLTSPERPTGIVEGDRYDASIAATIVNNKFGFYLPYYRMQDLFAGSGWTPSRSTLDNILNGLEFVVDPLVSYMWQQLLLDEAIGLDDTNVTLLMPSTIPAAAADDMKGQRLAEKMHEALEKGEASLRAKMWVYSGLINCPYNLFDFRVSRHRDGPAEVLAGYGGYVMADCYSGNLSVILSPESTMTRMACLSHARRHVYESRLNFPNETLLPLALLRQLYDIERRAVDYSADERFQLRTCESVLILGRLREWLDGPIARDALPKSQLGGAVGYLRNHWEALTVYLRDGRLPIDNNGVERLMKQIATGRKNWLFIGSVRAGERNAKLMSLVSSAHRHDLDVELYLTDITRQILSGSTDYGSMLPDVWKQSHPDAVRQYRIEERRDKADRSRYQAAARRAR